MHTKLLSAWDFILSMQTARDVPPFSGMACAKTAQSLRQSAISSFPCKPRETSRHFRERCAQKVQELETVCNFHHGCASRLRRPSIFVTAGAQSLTLSAISSLPCTPRETSRHFRERRAQKVLRACDCRQFSSWACKPPETSRHFRERCAQKVPRA